METSFAANSRQSHPKLGRELKNSSLFSTSMRSSGKGRNADSAEVEELAGQLLDYHGRDPKPAEMEVLRKFVALWRRGETQVSHYTLNDFGFTNAEGRAFHLYEPPISLEGHAPIPTPLLFWQYLAHHARKRGYGLPSFMAPLNDSEDVALEISRRSQGERANDWKLLFKREVEIAAHFRPAAARRARSAEVVAADEKARPFPEAVRLRMAPGKLQWEARDEAGAAWRPTRHGEAHHWFDAFVRGALPLDPASPIAAIFSQIAMRYYHERSRGLGGVRTDIQTLRLNESRTHHILRALLLTPAFQPLLVDDKGRPYQLPPQPLTWRAVPAPGDPEEILLSLAMPDGSEPDLSNALFLDLLAEPPYLALQGNSVFLCPKPIRDPKCDAAGANDEPSVGSATGDCETGEPRPAAPLCGPVKIPLEALSTPYGVRWLNQNGFDISALPLPSYGLVTLEPFFRVSFSRRASGSPERVQVQLEARSPDADHVHVRSCREWNWLVKRNSPAPGGAIVEYEMPAERIALAEKHLRAFDGDWEPFTESFVRRFAPSLLDELSDWLCEAAEMGFPLELEPEIEALARGPDVASLQLDIRPEEGDSGMDWFDLQVALKPGDTDLTPSELDLLLRARGKFVLIPGKGFRRIEISVEKERRESLRELGIETMELAATAQKHRFHTLQLAGERVSSLLPDKLLKGIRERASEIRAMPPPPLPGDLNATLRPYQIEGYQYLAHLAANHLGGVLADDMGLGKTVQTLAWLLWLRQGGAGRKAGGVRTTPFRALIVCPKSVVPNWILETARFAPSLSAGEFDIQRDMLPRNVEVTVLNYAQLRNNADAIKAVHWDAAILDEGQNIKNPASRSARTACEINATHRLVLTGTPIENKLLDLWSLFNFVMPGLLGPQARFRRAYNDRADETAQSRLSERVRHFMLRRTKRQVATDLPPRMEEDLFIDLEGAQRELYDAELKRARMALLNIKTGKELSAARFNILQSLMRLRQICCHPALVGVSESGDAVSAGEAGAEAVPAEAPKRRGRPRKVVVESVAEAADPGDSLFAPASAPASAIVDDDPDAPGANEDCDSAPAVSGKLDAMLEQIAPIIEEGHRVLVFSQFVSMLDIIHAELDRRGVRHLMLTGKTENRQQLVNEFQSASGPSVFLLSLKAAGSGLNLTAASYVFLFDPWWNPAVEAQAIDRTHRIGQTNQVFAYRLIARGTVEEKIRQLQNRKAKLANAVVKEDALASVLNLEDLRFVLS